MKASPEATKRMLEKFEKLSDADQRKFVRRLIFKMKKVDAKLIATYKI